MRVLGLVVGLLAALTVAPARAQTPTPTPEQEPAIEQSAPRRYGDAGTSEVSLLLGVSSAGVAFGGGFRHYVINALAPGVEAAVYRQDGQTQGFTFGTLRVVPVRFDSFALVLTGRAGRVFLSDHVDGWAYGGDAGVLVFLGPHVGLELGYEVLQLAPDSFCNDLTECVLQRPVIGLRISF